MKRFATVAVLVMLTGGVAAACVVRESPPPTSGAGGGGTAAPTATSAPTYAPNPTSTATAAPAPTATGAPTTYPTGTPTTTPPMGSPPPLPTGAPGGMLTLPGVCIPIGSWTKKFDSGIPASGTVDIGPPLLFNQFPVTDGVVIATAPVGTLKGVGAMTSTNDLSVDVSNGGFVVSYTCKFTGTTCNQGSCTTTKGGLGGFKLVKK